MKRTTVLFVMLLSVTFFACNTGNRNAGNNVGQNADSAKLASGNSVKGIGRFKDVPLTHPLDNDMIVKAKAIYGSKCMACHKLTDEKLVGPGWKGVTDRRTPEWVMNFITNTQVMLDKDLVAQSEVVTCLVRMPNQDLTDEQARQILEMMRQNDGKN